jgi:hypothetical protein
MRVKHRKHINYFFLFENREGCHWHPGALHPKNMGCTNTKPSCVETMMSSAPQVSYKKGLWEMGSWFPPPSMYFQGSHGEQLLLLLLMAQMRAIAIDILKQVCFVIPCAQFFHHMLGRSVGGT